MTCQQMRIYFHLYSPMLGDVYHRGVLLLQLGPSVGMFDGHTHLRTLGTQWLKFLSSRTGGIRYLGFPFWRGIVYNEFWYIHVNLWAEKVRFTVDVCSLHHLRNNMFLACVAGASASLLSESWVFWRSLGFGQPGGTQWYEGGGTLIIQV